LSTFEDLVIQAVVGLYMASFRAFWFGTVWFSASYTTFKTISHI